VQRANAAAAHRYGADTHVHAAAPDEGTTGPKEAARLFGATDANSSPSILEGWVAMHGGFEVGEECSSADVGAPRPAQWGRRGPPPLSAPSSLTNRPLHNPPYGAANRFTPTRPESATAVGGVRVSVLLRSAYGMPVDCRSYAKVSCGGVTYKTDYITGVADPAWQQLFTFDVNDIDHATLIFRCKHRRHFALTNGEHS